MNPTIERLKLIFLGLFALGNVAILIWTVGWLLPKQKCDEAHKWWDYSRRVCAQPVLISDLTGRLITDAKARAEAQAAMGRTPAAPKP